MSRLPVAAALAAAMVLTAAAPAAAADAAAGQKVYAKCRACHEVASEKNTVGPHLKGLFGRVAGTLDNYAYSKPMRDSGLTWDDDTLTTYLADPKAAVPGTKMVFVGLKKPEEIDNLLAYLREATR